MLHCPSPDSGSSTSHSRPSDTPSPARPVPVERATGGLGFGRADRPASEVTWCKRIQARGRNNPDFFRHRDQSCHLLATVSSRRWALSDPRRLFLSLAASQKDTGINARHITAKHPRACVYKLSSSVLIYSRSDPNVHIISISSCSPGAGRQRKQAWNILYRHSCIWMVADPIPYIARSINKSE